MRAEFSHQHLNWALRSITVPTVSFFIIKSKEKGYNDLQTGGGGGVHLVAILQWFPSKKGVPLVFSGPPQPWNTIAFVPGPLAPGVTRASRGLEIQRSKNKQTTTKNYRSNMHCWKAELGHPQLQCGCRPGSTQQDHHGCRPGRPPGPQLKLLPASPTTPQGNLVHNKACVAWVSLGTSSWGARCAAASCRQGTKGPHTSGHALEGYLLLK